MGGESETPDGRRAVGRILWTVLLLNLAVAAAKLVAGRWLGVISMQADGFHSLTDGAANGVALVGLAVASRPPDENHPYGHQRFETLAALAIGALLALSAWEILASCLARLRGGSVPSPGPLGFAVMGVTVLVNLGVTLYERRQARRLGSALLAADAHHTASDVYASLLVLVALVAARQGWPQLDLVAALVITGIIGWIAARVLRDNGLLLADTALVPAAAMRREALAVDGILSVHKIRSRGRPGQGQADLHVQVRADLRLDEAHALGHRVADRLRERFDLQEVLVHVEPPEAPSDS